MIVPDHRPSQPLPSSDVLLSVPPHSNATQDPKTLLHPSSASSSLVEQQQQQAQQFVSAANDQAEQDEKKMSVTFLSAPSDTLIMKTSKELNSPQFSYNGSKDDPTPEFVDGSPPTTPTVTAPQRAPCTVCKNEAGRCHASDPSMLAFFAATLGFDGTLNSSDWLCMKCYSKWYNRCKRKATPPSPLSLTVFDSNTAATPTPKRKRKEKGDKDGSAHKDNGFKDADRDPDNADALLLARIGTGFLSFASSSQNSLNSSAPTDDSSDLEAASLEDLRGQVSRLKKDMRNLVNDVRQRDQQIEGMVKFVHSEIATMRSLMQGFSSGFVSPSNPAPPQQAPLTPQQQPLSAQPAATLLSSSSSPHPLAAVHTFPVQTVTPNSHTVAFSPVSASKGN